MKMNENSEIILLASFSTPTKITPKVELICYCTSFSLSRVQSELSNNV